MIQLSASLGGETSGRLYIWLLRAILNPATLFLTALGI